jgi:hypothetical protein
MDYAARHRLEDCMRFASFCCVLVIFAQTMVLAQTNPVPFVNQPLAPASVKPGGKEFTLTVNGTGFASTAVINWNGKPILTSVESGNRLTAKISATKIRKIGTVSITVTNPAPGGGTSNVVYLPIRPTFSTTDMASFSNLPSGSTALTVGDFNNDGKLDIVVGQDNPYQLIEVLLGNGDGTFQSPVSTQSPFSHQYAMLAADFNGDGRLDLAVSDGLSKTGIFLGRGDGTFTPSGVFSSSISGPSFMAAGDFNGDGKLDLYVGGSGRCGQYGLQFTIYLGNGDGTFLATSPVCIPAFDTATPALGDFNGDGFLDLAVGDGAEGYINIFLGNGDGTFQPPVGYQAGYGGVSLAAADMNGDGILDLATYSPDGVAILLGKGDGTFVLAGDVQLFEDYQDTHNDVKVGDFNGDSLPDVALFYQPFCFFWLFLGNGDGTLQPPLASGFGFQVVGGLGFGMGDFNGDGRLDLVANDGALYLQRSVTASPAYFAFGNQTLGTTSPPQTVIFTNLNSSAVKINGIGITGTDSNDFSETNNCGMSVPARGSCQIKVTFTPQAVGYRTASLNIAYQGTGSPLALPIWGTGVTTTVSLTPSSLTFPTQLIGSTSSPQPATLTNTGTQDVTISSISTKSPFTQTNDCPSTLSAGTKCDIFVRFAPHGKGAAKGTLSVSDDVTGSPQTVSLSGVGTVVMFTPLGVNFGDQKVGKSSPPVPVKLFNKGKIALSITQITITGTNSGDFTEKNNCGQSVPAHGHCTITVTFTPSATGQRSGSVSVTDDGGGSPQSLPLAGTGT